MSKHDVTQFANFIISYSIDTVQNFVHGICLSHDVQLLHIHAGDEIKDLFEIKLLMNSAVEQTP